MRLFCADPIKFRLFIIPSNYLNLINAQYSNYILEPRPGKKQDFVLFINVANTYFKDSFTIKLI